MFVPLNEYLAYTPNGNIIFHSNVINSLCDVVIKFGSILTLEIIQKESFVQNGTIIISISTLIFKYFPFVQQQVYRDKHLQALYMIPLASRNNGARIAFKQNDKLHIIIYVLIFCRVDQTNVTKSSGLIHFNNSAKVLVRI